MYRALPLLRKPRMSVFDWTDPPQFEWTSPFHRKMKSYFCACTITIQTRSTFLRRQTAACKQPLPYVMCWVVRLVCHSLALRTISHWSCICYYLYLPYVSVQLLSTQHFCDHITHTCLLVCVYSVSDMFRPSLGNRQGNYPYAKCATTAVWRFVSYVR